jgi:dihydroorotase
LRARGISFGADLTILAPELNVTVSAAAFRSKSRNTPFDGWQLRGGVAATIVGGRVMFLNSDCAAGLGRA